jgi:hypothetical protein
VQLAELIVDSGDESFLESHRREIVQLAVALPFGLAVLEDLGGCALALSASKAERWTARK